MIFNIGRLFNFKFSIFKKKCMPIAQQKYSSFSQLYEQLSTFQQNLSELELKKMPKKLEDFTKRLKKLYKEDTSNVHSIPLKINHTYDFFVRKSDESIFGMPEFEVQTTLDQLLDITRGMTENSLTPYQELIPIIHQRRSLFEAIEQRFLNIEERLSRILFKNYTLFSKSTSKLSFLDEQRQYKGEFKFQLVDDMEILQKASQLLYHCALFNHLRNKMILACQIAVNKFYQKLSEKALSRFLFCLAVAGRPQKIIQQNFLTIAQKMRNHPLELLFYMTVSEIEDTFTLITLINNYKAQPNNPQQMFLCNVLKTSLNSKYGLNLQVQSNSSLSLPKVKSGGDLFFQSFLERYQYNYQTVFNDLMYHQIYNIQNIHFMCLDHRLIINETLTLNGLGIICKEYFVKKGVTLKHINWPRMLPMEKRGEKDEYILGKFKGIEKPKITRVKYYQ